MSEQLYRKRSLTAAVQFTGDNLAEVQAFTGPENFRLTTDRRAEYVAEVYDHLHDTWVGVESQSFIARGPKKEFYPINEHVFAETYEPVEDPQ